MKTDEIYKECLECGKRIDYCKYFDTRKYCGADCRIRGMLAMRKKKIVGRIPHKVDTITVGAIAELVVGADLLKMGFQVYRALSPHSGEDMMVSRDGVTATVQVTTGYYKDDRLLQLMYPPHPEGSHDLLAVVVHGLNEIVYLRRDGTIIENMPEEGRNVHGFVEDVNLSLFEGAYMNHVVLIGRVANDPVVKQTSGGKSVVNFSFAVDKEDGTDGADFFNIVAWDKIADVVGKYAPKGKQLGILGSARNRSYESNGQKKYIFEILANRVQLLVTKTEVKKDTRDSYEDLRDDELPFD